jgi:hypothetical protein
MSNGNHVFNDLNALLRKVRSLAGDYSKGALSRPEMIVNVAIAAREGSCTADDAEAIWSTFDTTLHNRLADVSTVGKKEGFGSDKAYKVRVSEVKTVIVAAIKHTDLPEWLNESRAVVAQLKAEGRYQGNMQDAFLSIARAAKKSDTALTDEEIVEAICPPSKDKDLEEKTELQRLLKAMQTVHNGKEGNPETGAPGRPAFPSERLAASMMLLEQQIATLVV